MAAVRMLAGRELRRRWRSTIALVLLVGVVGALVLATAAGARRTETALDRFDAFSRRSDVEISIGLPNADRLDRFRRTPGVGDVVVLRGYAILPEGKQDDELAVAAPVDDRMSRVVDRSRLISGRRADPDDPLEITIGESLAQQRHLAIGDDFTALTYDQDAIERAFSGENPGAPTGPKLRFHIVGIDRRPLDLGVREAAGGVIVLTPAFDRTYAGKIGVYTDIIRARGEHGAKDVAKMTAAARRIFGDAQAFGAQNLGVETEGARDAVEVLSLALWIVAGIAGIAGIVTIAIMLSRDLTNAAVDQPTLAALGLTRRRRIAIHLPRALLVALAGAVLAGVLAVLLSPRFPFGLARRADPDVGFHADWIVLGLGLLGLVVVVLGTATIAGLRVTRVAPDREIHARRRGSGVVARAATAGCGPTFTNGLRFAVQPGRGSDSVPARSAFLGAIVGVTGIVAALVFAASLTHLVDTPTLSGWTWDVHGDVPTASPCLDARSYGVERDPAVAAVGVVCTTFDAVEVGGRPVTAWGFRELHGRIDPAVVQGRAPRSADEIALGAVTLDAIGKHIGDTVVARSDKGPVRFRIVGQIVLPTVGDVQALADGAALTAGGFGKVYTPGSNETQFLIARGAPDATLAALEARFRQVPGIRFVAGTKSPVEVVRLEQIDLVPLALSILLALLAIAAVGHAVVVGVRRRRAELALLKVLGFTQGQVRATVAWQATILGAVGLVVGIPLGILVGRWAWDLVATGLGVRPVVESPVAWLVLAVGAALVIVNLIALVPGRIAARTRPAVALRTG
jgi:ABC-type lipoprotein release transport system permease subunit